jgi:hypothetical protein
MMLLEPDNHVLAISPQDCQQGLEQLPLAETHRCYNYLDKTRPKLPRKGKRPSSSSTTKAKPIR